MSLYTLVFGDNPFHDVDDTIKCVLKPPFAVSQGQGQGHSSMQDP